MWKCYGELSRGGIFTELELFRALLCRGFSTEEIYPGEIVHGINSKERIFRESKFLLGGRLFMGKLSYGGGILGVILKTIF